MLKATLLLCLITGLIFMLDTLSYSLRLVVYRNQQYNLTSSTYNMISLVAKTVIVFQMPLLGVLLDVCIGSGRDPLPDFRLILLWATGGVLLSIIVLPWFIPIFTKLVNLIAETGSYWGAARILLTRGGKTVHALRERSALPDRSDWHVLWNQRWFLLLHGVITAVYAVSLLSAYYAAYLYPSHRLSLAGFSGVINGFATILMTLILEPHIALTTDRALKGEADYIHLKGMVLALTVSKLGGVVAAQMLLIPAAYFILKVFKVLVY